MVYRYDLYNNHIVTTIDNKNYLIDTGSYKSFWTYSPIKEVIIDDKPYKLTNKPELLDLDEMEKLVGTKIDGFIGMDILFKTSLTIRKHTESSGELLFSAEEVDGKSVTIYPFAHPTIDVMCNNQKGRLVIDTGARYGYLIKEELIKGQEPAFYVEDYNPFLGEMVSGVYRVNINIGNRNRNIEACFNKRVCESLGGAKDEYDPIIIINIMPLFDNVCVLDLKKGVLTLD